MNRLTKPSIGFIFVIFMVACATKGNDFDRIPNDALVLGKTTIADIVSSYGTLEFKDVQVNNVVIKQGSYSLTKASSYKDLISQKIQYFSFNKGVLVGYKYTNSFPENPTDFDDSLRSQIKQHESTLNDVVRLLGPPTGKAIYPFTVDPDSTIIKYSYWQVKQRPTRYYNKELKVTINKEDIVTDINYIESGVK